MSHAFVHEALYYRTLDEYLANTVPFVRDGLAAGEPVLVAVPEPQLARLRAQLGGDAKQVRFIDMAEEGRNPNRIIPWVLRSFVDSRAPGRVRVIGEPIFVGRRPAELGPCVQHEALINVALANANALVLCPYDVVQLPHMVSDAGRTHPVIVEGDGSRRPGDYLDPATVVALHNTPLPEPPMVAEALVFDARRLGDVRRIIAQHGAGAGLSPERIADAQVAVTEIATNALTHGGPGIATLRAWTDPEHVVYEIRAAGHIEDPMAGRVVPSPDAAHGRGLLVANRLCDLIETHTMVTGTVTRMHLGRPR